MLIWALHRMTWDGFAEKGSEVRSYFHMRGCGRHKEAVAMLVHFLKLYFVLFEK